MDNYYINLLLLFGTYVLALLFGILNFSVFDKPARIYCGLILLSFVGDGLAVLSAFAYGSTAKVYTVKSIFYFFVCCLYFNEVIPGLRKKKGGLYIGLISVVLGITNTLLLQPFGEANSYFRLFGALLVICLGLTALGFIVIAPGYINIRHEPHFWLTAVLVFFWASTYLHWLLYDYFTFLLGPGKSIIDSSILYANVLANISVAFIFFLYPKIYQPHETTSDG